MPYKLSGNKVVRSDTGQVVKDHGDDHAKAVRHLRALKANVEEAERPRPEVLGALLEFDPAELRNELGRWIRTNDGRKITLHAARREQTDYHAAHGKPSPFLPSHVKPYTAKDDPHPAARDRLAHVRGLADAGRKAQATRAEILAKSPNAQRELEQHQAVARGAAQELARTRQAIASLRPGGRYDLHGGEGKIGHVLHASGGRYEVHHGGEMQVHRTPSSAAGHAMRLQRTAHSRLPSRQAARAARTGRLQAAAAPEVLGALLEGAAVGVSG